MFYFCTLFEIWKRIYTKRRSITLMNKGLHDYFLNVLNQSIIIMDKVSIILQRNPITWPKQLDVIEYIKVVLGSLHIVKTNLIAVIFVNVMITTGLIQL